MKILDFIDTISNRVSRFNVLNTLDNEITFLEDKLIPKIETLMKTYPSDLPTNYTPMTVVLKTLADKKPGKGVRPLLFSLQAYLKQAKVLAKYSKDNLADETILKDALTYRTVTVLQYAETLAFVTRYATRLVDGFLYAEYYQANKDSIPKPSVYQVNMSEWLTRNRHSFTEAIKLGGLHEREVEENLEAIPDKVINVQNFEMDVKSAQYGLTSLDPMGFGIITGRWSIIYLGRDLYERARNALNDSRKEDLVSIELKLLYLTETAKGRRDPKVGEKIERLERRQKDLYLKVRKFESELDDE